MKIGILKLSHLGDIIHTIPLAFLISKYRPDYKIYWIMEKTYFNAFNGLSFINTLIPFSFNKKDFFSSLKKLREENLDIIFDLQGLYKTALLSFFSNSCKRVGFSFKDLKEKFLFFFYHKKIKAEGKHIVEKNLSFASFLGIKDFDLSDYNLREISVDREGKVSNFLEGLKFPKYGVFHPFSSDKKKDFPYKKIFKLSKILKERDINLILTYGPNQEKDADEVSKYLNIIKFPEVLKINEMAYLIERAKFFIGPDTGFYHIADHLRVPTIGYFAWYPPERNGNYFSQGLSFFKEEIEEEKILSFLEENCSFF